MFIAKNLLGELFFLHQGGLLGLLVHAFLIPS